MSDDLATWLRKRFINEKEWYGVEYEELNEAADRLETQEKLIQELASELANGVELLEIIKEHWIDYDHIYSIFAHEAKELASKSLSKAKSQQGGETE